MNKNRPLALIALTLLLLVAPVLLAGCPPHDDLRPTKTGAR